MLTSKGYCASHFFSVELVGINLSNQLRRCQMETTIPLPKRYGICALCAGSSNSALQASTEVSVTSATRSKPSIPGMGEFLGCVEMLISFGADVNAATGVLETSLHYTPAFDQ